MTDLRDSQVSPSQVLAVVEQTFGITGNLSPLPSYIDQNFRLDGEAGTFVIKVAHAAESREALALENAMMARLSVAEAGADVPRCPAVRRSLDGAELVSIPGGTAPRWLRVVSFLPGILMADARPLSPSLLRNFGGALGGMDRALAGFDHPGASRHLRWDLQHLEEWAGHTRRVADRPLRAGVEAALLQFFAVLAVHRDSLRRSVIHNDANDHNVLVAGDRVTGILDFGDAVATCTVFNLAIAAAYAVLDSVDPVADLLALVRGYHEAWPLGEDELEVLFPALCARLAQSVLIAEATLAAGSGGDPDYVAVSQRPVRATLLALGTHRARVIENRLRGVCGFPPRPEPVDPEVLQGARGALLGPSLSLSYRQPLTILRGRGAYLFDADGRAFVDGVNNVCHVGHCHPRVVRAATEQMATLNTNTRYLHPNLVEYAARLTSLFPSPLSVCFFVCSGSEANELALRMARAHTGREDVVVLDAAYHGNTTALVELSPYKHNGPGGRGTPAHVHVADLPDPFRGVHRGDEEGIAALYARSVADACARAAARQGSGGGAAAFFAESISGCGGQVDFPKPYLKAAHAHVRAAGALYVADEVQVGFGRVGTHMWAFEAHDVVPDIVTLGKPIGNGHPMAAVITTPAIAGTFANGMEYFNTFGGNPVSAAIGSAVLDVIESEGLMAHAATTGARLLAGFRDLQPRFPCLGDVRGRGLFLGVEFVTDPVTREPDAATLAAVVEAMKDNGFLLSIDGPDHNVLKFKPPLSFSTADADLLLAVFERVMEDVAFA